LSVEVAELKDKKVVFFHGDLSVAAGSQKVTSEEVKYFESQGAGTYILTCNFRPEALFNETVKADIQVIGGDVSAGSLLTRVADFPRLIITLRKKIKAIGPDIIISRNPWECMYLYLATLFTPFPYATHIHETLLWANGGVREKAFIYRKAVNRIKQSTAAHREFAPITSAKANPLKRILTELSSLVEYLAVRKAKKIFVLSNQVKWEVRELYGRDSIIIKAAFPASIFSYQPKEDIKQKLGLSGKRIVFSVSALTKKKRVSILIEAFQQICRQLEDVVLVIGGTGSEEKSLKNLVHELNIEDRVKFTGFIPEEVLWDYYSSCDVFAYPDRTSSAMTPFVALALQKKVVWTTAMEIDEHLAHNQHIFVASPNASDFAQGLEKALTTEVTARDDLSPYTWERYCQGIAMELGAFLRG